MVDTPSFGWEESTDGKNYKAGGAAGSVSHPGGRSERRGSETADGAKRLELPSRAPVSRAKLADAAMR